MKYRVIIADDEPMLIRLIRELGKFNEYDIEIIDECYDGETAYQSILKNKPDFVLSDIKMPVYDGLTLMEKVREKLPDTLFILLSGYRLFEYARDAVRLNAVDYLLKPVDGDQLNELLRKVCKIIDDRRADDEEKKKLQDYVDAEQRERENLFWARLADRNGSCDISMLTPETVHEALGFSEKAGLLQCLMIRTNLRELFSSTAISFQDKISGMIRSRLEHDAQISLFEDDLGFYILLKFNKEQKNRIQNAISGLFYEIRDLSEIYGSFNLQIGIGNIVSRELDIPETVHLAQNAAYGGMVIYGNQVIRYDQVMKLASFKPEEIIEPQEKRFLNDAMHYLRRNELGELFAMWGKRARAKKNSNTGNMLDTFIMTRCIVLESTEPGWHEEIAGKWVSAVRNTRDFVQFFELIYGILDSILIRKQQEIEKKGTKPVEDAVNFVRKNFAMQISLEEAAKQAGVSPTYLSKLFKDTTGQGFNEFLTGVRIEEAERLLIETRLPMKDIAISVGYFEAGYFSKIFKKVTGIKPKDYRRLYG